MRMDFDAQNIRIFGKSVNLENEWQKIAGNLGILCEGNRYIEYNKEIARLRAKMLHLQEEVDGFRARNQNLSSMNDGLVERVKDLISMQDSQLEHYSTALVLLTEERKELWHSLGCSQKKINQLEKDLASCRCRNASYKDSSDEASSVASSQDVGTNTENTEEVASQIRRSSCDGVGEKAGVPVPPPAKETRPEEGNDRHLESFESTLETKRSGPMTKAKGSFVNSMVQKLEKSGKGTKKYKLHSFVEPDIDVPEELMVKANRAEEMSTSKSDDCESIPESVPESVPDSLAESGSDVESLKFRVLELEQEVLELRETCSSLTGMLERTYDEMQSSASERDDTKDQLIACLRARLLEAICDLMKVEKGRDVKSVACGSSLPRAHKAVEPSAPPIELYGSKSEPVVSPGKSKAYKMLASPSAKLKALRDDNYSKLKKFSCWNPKTPDESA